MDETEPVEELKEETRVSPDERRKVVTMVQRERGREVLLKRVMKEAVNKN